MLAGVTIAVAVGLAAWLLRPSDPPVEGSSAASTSARFPWELQPAPPSLVPLDEIVSGGPPPDGIPPIDKPKFETVAQADPWLEDREPVILLEHRGSARAYPLQVLTWHEIVNDEVGGDPITVTFCPLCNSAIAFERRVETTDASRNALGSDRAVLDFGTSGRLYRSNLVMYDRQTKSLWLQFTGQAVTGPFMRADLTKVAVQIVSWKDFASRHPDGRVLSRDTENPRNYGSNPYAGYDSVDSSPFLYDGPLDDRLRPMERVVAVNLDGRSRAYTYRALRSAATEGTAVHDETVGEQDVVVFYRLGTASALDDPDIASSADVGTTGVFESATSKRRLTFEVNGEDIVDEQTGSVWSIDGRAVGGPLKGTQLEPVVHDDTFWFVWAAFRTETSFWDG